MMYKRCSGGGYVQTASGAAKGCKCTPTGFLVTLTGITECCLGSTRADDLSLVFGNTYFIPWLKAFSSSTNFRLYGVLQKRTYGIGSGCTGSFTLSDIQFALGTNYNSGTSPTFNLFGRAENSQIFATSPNVAASSFPVAITNASTCGASSYGTGGSATVDAMFTVVALGSSSASYSNASGSGSISFTADDDWHATQGTLMETTVPLTSIGTGSPESWITLTGSTSGSSGSNSVTYDVAANGTGSARTAYIFVQNQAFQVNQAA